jgi:hypothetical protein
LRQALRAIVPAENAIAKRRLWLGAVALVLAAASAQGAEPAPPVQWSAEGSFPLQSVETVTRTSRQTNNSAAPYLGLTATAHLQPDLTGSVFANGGHNQLGSFRDNDNTFLSAGANLAKHWGALRAGVSFERTHYFDDVFGPTTNIANDVNVFTSYLWKPNPDLQIRPSASVTMRLDDALAVQRYSYGARIDIEQRLWGSWWLVASPRFRYLDYVGSEAGRRDTRLALVGGLKYAINASISARVLAGYENRTSNIATKASDKYTFGASLDFDIDLARPRSPASR